MVVLRNALERRSELAVLAALGYRAGQVRRLLWHEHGGLLALGLLVGIISATVATLPGIGRGALQMGLLVLALAMSGAIWVELAAVAATRGSLQSGLRDE
jgi:ABC-type antimicrobial peptide transport system permease subunit